MAAATAAKNASSRGDREGQAKILRIGILQNRQIVEERLVRKRENVTIGQSTKNTFVVPASNALPRSFTLFELTPQGYALNFTDAMDGRVSFGDSVVMLPSLRQAGQAQKKGETWHLLLNDKSRGKVVIGDVTVLFQFVTAPPVQPRPQLPPSVRSSLMQNLDWMLVAVVGASFLVHFGFVLYLRNVDWPRKPDIEELPDRFVQMIVPPKKEEPKKEVAKADDSKKKAEDDEAKKAEREKRNAEKRAAAEKAKADPEAAARAAAEKRARMEAEAKMAVAKLLGARGEGGTVADLLKGGDVSGDADKAFQGVGGVGVAGAAGTGLGGKGTGGTGSRLAGGSLKASGPGVVGTGEKGGERAVKAVVKDSAPESVDNTLDTAAITNTVKRNIGGVKACYEAGLKRNPSMGGKVTVRWNISSVGKVTSVDVENDTLKDDEVVQCIKGKVQSWRFPPGGGGEVVYPFVFQASK
jgi:hypothetical protein